MTRSRQRTSRSPADRALDAVEQAPVRPEGGLRGGHQLVLVGLGGQLLDQLARLGGVLGVAALVDAEVRGPRAVGEPVAVRAGPRAWSARSRAGRSRSRTGVTSLASRSSPPRGRLGATRRARTPRSPAVGASAALPAGGLDEAVPEGARGRAPRRRGGAARGARAARSAAASRSVAIASHRVAVLARVARQLLAAQLAGRPAPVEGVAKHVPALAGLLDPLPSPLVT